MNTQLKLVIKRQDTSIYWIEHFNSIEQLNIWLNEEQTRSYWDNTYTWQIFEIDSQGSETLYV